MSSVAIAIWTDCIAGRNGSSNYAYLVEQKDVWFVDAYIRTDARFRSQGQKGLQ